MLTDEQEAYFQGAVVLVFPGLPDEAIDRIRVACEAGWVFEQVSPEWFPSHLYVAVEPDGTRSPELTTAQLFDLLGQRGI
jgi:hypothetical protein